MCAAWIQGWWWRADVCRCGPRSNHESPTHALSLSLDRFNWLWMHFLGSRHVRLGRLLGFLLAEVCQARACDGYAAVNRARPPHLRGNESPISWVSRSDLSNTMLPAKAGLGGATWATLAETQGDPRDEPPYQQCGGLILRPPTRL